MDVESSDRKARALFCCTVYWTHEQLSYHHQMRNISRSNDKKGDIMKGYNTESGYMGYIQGRYILFISEEEYEDYVQNAA
jgi:hypothetical protein